MVDLCESILCVHKMELKMLLSLSRYDNQMIAFWDEFKRFLVLAFGHDRAAVLVS